MPTISLTEFIDFVVASGTSRITKVKNIKCRAPYQPAIDYWKSLRESIDAFHDPANTLGKDAYFRNFLAGTNPTKLDAYTAVVDNYKKFLGRKVITKLPIRKNSWTRNDLTVRVNPEVFLNINGSRTLIKLYFKQEKLSKIKTDAILTLLQHAIPVPAGVDEFAVYDSRNNRLLSHAAPNPALMVLVESDADAFMTIWNGIACP